MVEAYIKSNWEKCIRENTQDDGTLIGLPKPYIVPCVGGMFQEMYYWDTYFTNKGLALSGLWEQVKNNTDDMLYLVERYGYMPNGNRTFYLTRSQPPYLSMMVRDVYDHYQDKSWLEGAYNTLKKEYAFWQENRMTETGLNQYGGTVNEASMEELVPGFAQRVGVTLPYDDPKLITKHHIVHCESGWDINPRWGFTAYDYVQIDVNALLYALEINMSFFASELKNREESLWSERAAVRRTQMERVFVTEDGLYFDYNFVTETHSSVFSAGSFYPLLVGAATEQQAKAARDALPRLEAAYGVLTCEKNDVAGNYQWDYPNGWAPIQYIVIQGLRNYGYIEDAKRLAKKYVALVDSVFEKTGCLWEKYNVVEGSINVTNEYEMPAMMGWSAGVYLYCADLCKQ